MQIESIGIDLGKTIFHLVALCSRGQVVVRKKLSRQQPLLYTANLPSSLIGQSVPGGGAKKAFSSTTVNYTANLPSCLMGMEDCVGSHFLGRALRE